MLFFPGAITLFSLLSSIAPIVRRNRFSHFACLMGETPVGASIVFLPVKVFCYI